MKLNNKGFAISSIMYIILVLAVILISLILVTLSSRKLILDKLKDEVLTTIYESPNISYRQTIKQLKSEAIAYMTTNSLDKESIKVESLSSSIDNEVLEKYKLNDKYLTAVQNADSYDVYLGKTTTISNTLELPKNTIDIVDYKIYGNSYQQTYSGKNLFANSETGIKQIDNGYIMSTISNKSIINISGISSKDYGFRLIETSNKLEPGTYTVSVHNLNSSDRLYVTDETGEILVNYITVNSPKNIVVDEASKITVYGVFASASSYNNSDIKVQIEKGIEATEYEPYVGGIASPNLDYPAEVESVGEYDETTGKYKIPVKVSGKNLFKKENVNLTLHKTSLRFRTINPDNEVILQPNTYKLTLFTSNEINLKNGLKYSILITQNGTNKEIYLEGGGESTNGVFTLDTLTILRGVYVFLSSSDNDDAQITIDNIQLEVGDIATEYEPYVEPKTTNIYLDEPLRKIDEYTDYIEFENTKIAKKIKEIMFNGTESFVKYPDSEGLYYSAFSSVNYALIKHGVSNRFNLFTYGALNTKNSDFYITKYAIYFRLMSATTLDEFVKWVSDNNVQVNYVLEIPIEENIYHLPKINTSVGATKISIDTDILPSNYEFTVVEKIIEI